MTSLSFQSIKNCMNVTQCEAEKYRTQEKKNSKVDKIDNKNLTS